MTISIAIPTYEMGGLGAIFLAKALDSIKSQSTQPFEVVISDHSVNDQVEEICKTFKNDLNIIYIRNEEKRGNFPANLNNAVRNCTGDIIKFLMQDDFLYDNSCIDKFIQAFSECSGVYWIAAGCKFGRDKNGLYNNHEIIPKFSFLMAQSVNTIGSPSVVAIRNKEIELFNENLQWVVDLDYYLRLQNKHKMPLILEEYLVFVLQHENQISETMPQSLKDKEQEWLAETYKQI